MSFAVKRTVDFLVAALLLALAIPMFLVVSIVVKLTSHGPIIYSSVRVGQHGTRFRMHKFRTMTESCPEVATHELEDPKSFLTPAGGFLRRSSLDELPQLLNVLHGEMSLVGPRPALHSQADLINLRAGRGVDVLRPGITGLAQVMGRDSLTIEEKVDYEVEYLRNRSPGLDLRIIAMTLQRVIRFSGVTH